MHDSTLDDIRSKIDIVPLVQEYTELKKAGRNWKGLCPFHKERTPSFMVSPDKQIAYCFGCHKGGDIFAFLMEVERTDFPGAMRLLADKAGIELPEKVARGPNKSEKETLIHILEESQVFYVEALKQQASAMEYLEKRRLSQEIIEHFGIGFAPDSFDDLWRVLREKQWMTDDVLKSGMLNSSGNKYYNRFRNRIMFPVHNALGQPIAYAGRIFGEGEPKYLNSPESPVYSKSHTLYNMHRAKEAIRQQNTVIVVEGYMDVISSWQNGVQNIVAPCGTALTREQITQMSRYAEKIILLFDEDNAGQEATIRNSMLCLEEDVHPYIVSLQADGVKDVDEFWHAHSIDDFHKHLDGAKPFMEHYLFMLKKQYNLSQVQLKRKAVDLYLDALITLKSSVEQQEYLRMAARHLDVDSPTLYAELSKKKDPKTRVRRATSGFEPHPFSSPSHVLMAVLLTYPDLSSELSLLSRIESLPQEFPNALLQFFRKEVGFEPTENIVSLVPEVLRKQTDMLLLFADEHGILETREQAQRDAQEKLQILIQQRKKHLITLMEKAQEAKDALAWHEAYSELQSLQKG